MDTKTTSRPTLDTLIRTVVANTAPEDDINADDICNAVLDQISDDLARLYLRDAIRARLSSVVGTARGNVTPNIRKGVSTKQSLIREQHWPAFLQQRVSLPSGYKQLAQCTVEDLRVVADVRRTQATELLTRANQFTVLADLMEQSGAHYLEQLSPDLGGKALAEAA